MCKRAIWLDHGAVMMDGDVSDVLDAYEGRQRPLVAEPRP
jgi:ABC-type polysaccharide/polyol phosphate transport system ATPase subunit